MGTSSTLCLPHTQINKIMFKESYYLKDSQKKMFIPYRIVGVFFNGG